MKGGNEMVDKNKAIENLNRNIEFIKERKGLHTDAELCREAGIAFLRHFPGASDSIQGSAGDRLCSCLSGCLITAAAGHQLS